MRSTLLVLLCFSFSLTNSFAQELGKSFVTNFSPSVYEAHTQNWSIVQSHQGLIYVGNNFGVLEYDGVTWRLIPVSNNSVVRSLTKAPDGSIYVGAQGEFGRLVTDSIGGTAFESFVSLLPDSIIGKFSNVWETVALADGRVLFTADSYLFIWLDGKLTIHHSKKGFHRAHLVGNRIFVRHEELGLVELVGNQLKPLPFPIFKNIRVYSLLPYKDNRLLAISRAGCYAFDPDLTIAPKLVYQNSPISNETIYHGILLKNGNYAFCTLGNGVLIANRDGKVVQHITQETGIIDDVVINLFEDDQGGLWIGTNNGISHIELSSPISYFDQQVGLPPGVNTILRHKEKLYVGTDVGIYYLENNRFNLLSTFEESQIWDLVNYPIPNTTDTLLLIASEIGSYAYNGTSVQNIYDDVTFQFLIDQNNPKQIFIAHANQLATAQYDELRKRFAQVPAKYVAKSEIRKVTQMNDQIWLGTSFSGIDRLNSKLELTKTYDSLPGLSNLKDIYPYQVNDQLLLATTNGLYKFAPQEDRFQQHTLGLQHLEGNKDIYRIAIREDNDEIWTIGVESGKSPLTVFYNGNIPNHGPYQRLPKQSYEEIYHDNDRRTWLGGANGVYCFDMDVRFDYYQTYPTYIRKVLVGEDSLIYNGSFGKSVHKKINLSYENNNLTFHYASPTFDGDEPNQYSFKLAGYDKKRSAWTTDTKQHYTNLPEQDYIFEVFAKNAYGHESSVGRFEFTIQPPFYRTKLAYAGYAIALAGLFWGFAQLYARRLRREKERLERLVKERTLVIEDQKNDILGKNAELGQQNEEIMAQRDLLNSQNVEIQRKNNQITSSINYAQRIQQSMLPSPDYLNRIFNEHFVLFMPRDVVSGDFYWATQKHDHTLVAAVDCTGHGVPGAFMSMIGDTLLNQIVSEKGITAPNKILALLNSGVRKVLKQKESANQDGMDMSLCSIDPTGKTLHFAGAKNNLIYIQNNELHYVKGDRMSIGGFKVTSQKHNYQVHSIPINSPTSCYLFTDGYIDQMGGAEKRKFMTKRFKDLLLQIQDRPMAEQEQLLKENILAWMEEGNEKQIDDIMVVGFQVG